MNNRKDKRGGARLNAGRPPLLKKKIPVTFRHHEDEIEILRQHYTGKELANKIRNYMSQLCFEISVGTIKKPE